MFDSILDILRPISQYCHTVNLCSGVRNVARSRCESKTASLTPSSTRFSLILSTQAVCSIRRVHTIQASHIFPSDIIDDDSSCQDPCLKPRHHATPLKLELVRLSSDGTSTYSSPRWIDSGVTSLIHYTPIAAPDARASVRASARLTPQQHRRHLQALSRYQLPRLVYRG